MPNKNFRFYEDLQEKDPEGFKKTLEDFRRTLTLEHPMERVQKLTREAVDMENRIVSLSISSEAPVKRWFGTEILGHDPGEIDTSRLDASAPWLWMHDFMDQRGVILSYEIANGRMTFKVKLSRSDEGEELLNDIQDGITPNTSIGYKVLEFKDVTPPDAPRDADPIYRAVRWMPYEGSSVTIPADFSVGVGRSAEADILPTKKEVKPMTRIEELSKKVADGSASEAERAELGRMLNPPAAPAPVVQVNQDEARDAERARVEQIETLLEKFPVEGGRALAKAAVKEGLSVSEFGMRLLEAKGVAKPIAATDKPQGNLGMSEGDLGRYSIGNLIRIQLGLAKEEGVEIEAHRALIKDKKLEARNGGFLVPAEVLSRAMFGGPVEQLQRVLDLMGRTGQTATTPSKGGYLVQQSNMGFDELLRNRQMTKALGVRSLPNLRDNVALPRLASGSTAYWLSPEGSDITESEASFGQILLSPKTVGALVNWTRQLAMQANPAIDSIMSDDLNIALALAIDKAVLHGSGASGQPLGIANTVGVSAPSLASADWQKIINLETLVAIANADVAGMAFLTTPAFRGTLKGRAKATNYPSYLWENNLVNGYRGEVTNQVNSGFGFFGDWTRAVLGEWGVLELAVSEHTKFSSGGIQLRAFQTVDVGVRQPGAFAVASDAS